MAMQFTIAYDSTTIDCQADGYTLLDGYYPETASDPNAPVTDQARLLVQGSTPAALQSKIQALNLAFEHARTHQTGASGCYLSFSPDGTLTAWRTRITNGITLLDAGLGRRWKQNKAVVGLAIERAPWWEGAEAQIPLTNSNGTNNTTGLTVYNHDDAGAGHDNYVQIAAASVGGDLPAATRLELINTYATGRLYDCWIGHNTTDPANLGHILEAESAVGATPTAEVTCSGGNYARVALASGAEADLFTWALSANFLNACQGRFFKLLARFYLASPTDVRFRAKLLFEDATIWQSGQVSLDALRLLLIRDLFTLRLPPWLDQQTGHYALSLKLTGEQDTGASVNVDLDFLQVTPVDGWRYLTCAGYGVTQNARVVDDGINSDLYRDAGNGTGKAGILIGYGSPILLEPATLQRLYFLQHDWTLYDAQIDRTMTVKLYYRPRRQNL